jgi:enoyl-CoA hydratase/carnithine racemase
LAPEYEGQPIRTAVEDRIATVTIDRPARKNALSIAAANGLTSTWRELESNDRVGVIVLTSADCGVFSAGLDLKEAKELAESEGVDILTRMEDPFHTVMRSVTKPIIAAMTGSAMAGGMLLSLNCDIRIGLAGTSAGITEVRIGRGSPWAAPLLWMLPQPTLSEMLLTGEPVPIERLRDLGFVNYVEPTPDHVRARAYDIASRILLGAPLSLKAAKASMAAWQNLGCQAGFEEAVRLHEEVYRSRDASEGPRAFAERRAPRWEGR